MPVPMVAIVGRPNVGKSSLFNMLAGRRIAIVDPTAGVTRDRVSTLIEHEGRYFELVDTGGMGIHDVDHLTEDVERQIQVAIDQANVVLFVGDGRSGLNPLDEHVANRLRGIGKPVICLANKCDAPALDLQAAEFYKLGFDDILCVSAQQKRGRGELFERILQRLPEAPEGQPPEVRMKLAIVGRRNTGKSTFINSLAQAERMIVSEVPGTTRDSVDVHFERDGHRFIAIDTAGVRRKRSLQNDIEFYSLHRAERSIRRADVVLLFFDAEKKISKVDKKLAEYILDQDKPAIFVVNKWDLMKPHLVTGDFAEYLRKVFPSLSHVPIAFITAKNGKNVQNVLNLAQNLYKQAGARVSTADLNRVIRKALEDQAPPLRFNRRAKIYFATQVAVYPPTIVLFTNGPELIDKSYRRYLLNCLREGLPFAEVPIRLYLRARQPREGQEEIEAAEPEAVRPKKRPIITKFGTKKPAPHRETSEEPELWKDL